MDDTGANISLRPFIDDAGRWFEITVDGEPIIAIDPIQLVFLAAGIATLAEPPGRFADCAERSRAVLRELDPREFARRAFEQEGFSLLRDRERILLARGPLVVCDWNVRNAKRFARHMSDMAVKTVTTTKVQKAQLA